jgi:hypothetical protein
VDKFFIISFLSSCVLACWIFVNATNCVLIIHSYLQSKSCRRSCLYSWKYFVATKSFQYTFVALGHLLHSLWPHLSNWPLITLLATFSEYRAFVNEMNLIIS